VSLEIPDKLRELQIKRYRNAKNEPEFRFCLLYDKVYRTDVLVRAWGLAKANNGCPGVDGQSFGDIESEGVMGWLNGPGKDLREKTYRAIAGYAGDDRKGRRGRASARDTEHTGPGGADGYRPEAECGRCDSGSR